MYREIVTKAVIAKGKIVSDGELTIKTIHNPSKVLGCWIINHYYVGCYENEKVLAKGKYDIHVWYGYNNDSETTIQQQTIDYVEEFPLKIKQGETISEDSELSIRCSKYPTCSGLKLNDDYTINVKVEKELVVDVIGETKLKVQVSPVNDDEYVVDSEIDGINVNYIKKD